MGTDRDRSLIAAVVAATVAYEKERIQRELAYGAGLAGVGVMAASCDRVGRGVARIVVATRGGARVSLLCDAARVGDVVAAIASATRGRCACPRMP